MVSPPPVVSSDAFHVCDFQLWDHLSFVLQVSYVFCWKYLPITCGALFCSAAFCGGVCVPTACDELAGKSSSQLYTRSLSVTVSTPSSLLQFNRSVARAKSLSGLSP